MKKIILLLALCGLSTLSMTAQDDLYFTPKKSHKAKAFDDNTPAYYVGSNRAVDEYNRRGKFCSSYQKIEGDSISDVIDLQAGDGLYPDSTYVDSDFAETLTKKRAQGYRYDDDDFEYTRRMSRWDGFYGPWYAGWHSPFWYGRYGYYDPWDPWYWDWYHPHYYPHYPHYHYPLRPEYAGRYNSTYTPHAGVSASSSATRRPSSASSVRRSSSSVRRPSASGGSSGSRSTTAVRRSNSYSPANGSSSGTSRSTTTVRRSSSSSYSPSRSSSSSSSSRSSFGGGSSHSSGAASRGGGRR